jgi:hypothetical protein
MATEKQIAANRANAQKSTGPKTAAGRLKSSRNALRHGLSVPLSLSMTTAKADALARVLASDQADVDQLAAATEVAHAQMELLRIRAVRAEMTAQVDLGSADVETLRRLAALDRYERFALTKRRRASQKL